MRVVSIACSNTEIACALGAGEELVGVDNHSDFPIEVVKRLPRVGPDLEVDVAAIARLKPDLVLASLTVPGHERNLEALSAAKLPFIAPEPCTLSDVYADIRQIGAALGRSERAEALVAGMQAEIVERETLHGAPRVLVEWWPKPVIAPGRRSWVDALIRAAGGANPLADRDVKSTPLSNDEVLRLSPDAFVMSWCGVRVEKYRSEVVYRRPGYGSLPAIRLKRVFPIAEAFLGRPGPRLVEGYRELCRVVKQAQERTAEVASIK